MIIIYHKKKVSKITLKQNKFIPKDHTHDTITTETILTKLYFSTLLLQADTGPVTFAPLFQGNPISNPFNRPQTVAPTSAPVTQPPLVTTTDPDDVIYSDELKPVHEDYDPINEPYVQNKLPPG